MKNFTADEHDGQKRSIIDYGTMKNLRYSCFMVICSLLFFGCNKEEVESDEGLIIGEWLGRNSVNMIFADGSEVRWQEDGGCRGSIMHFFGDGKLDHADWVKDDILPDNCKENEETPRLGRWERVSNGKYIFTLIDGTGGPEVVIEPESITFITSRQTDNSIDDDPDIMTIRYTTLPASYAPEGALYYSLDFIRR